MPTTYFDPDTGEPLGASPTAPTYYDEESGEPITLQEAKLRAAAEGHFASRRPEPFEVITGATTPRRPDRLLGGSSAQLRPADDRGPIDRLRDWVTGAASDQRITDEDRAAAREAGIGLVPNKRELAEAALTAGAIIATPQLVAAAPATSALAFGGSMAATPIGGKLGEVLGEEIGPGVGETFGRPVGELAASVAGGTAAIKASPTIGRATQKLGRTVYARGLEEPAPTSSIASKGDAAPLTRRKVADELIDSAAATGEGIPVRASTVRQRARDFVSNDVREKLLGDILAHADDTNPAVKAAVEAAKKALYDMPAADVVKAGGMRATIRPLIAALRKAGKGDEARAIIDRLDSRTSALIAASRTRNFDVGSEELLLGMGGVGGSVAGMPLSGPTAAAVIAARQPIPYRAAGAGLVNVGRSLEQGPPNIMALLRSVGKDLPHNTPPPAAPPATPAARPAAPTPTAPAASADVVGSPAWRARAFSRPNGPTDAEWAKLGGSKAKRAWLESQGKVSEGEPPIGRGGRRETARTAPPPSQTDPASDAPSAPLDRLRALADEDAATIGETAPAPSAPNVPPTPSAPEGTNPALRSALSKTPAGRQLQSRIDALANRPEPASLIREANRAATEFNLPTGSKVWYVAGNDGAPVSWHPSQQQAARATKGRPDLSVRWTRSLGR